GLPSVRVPVLSRATAEIFALVSRNSPPLMRMPSLAPRPMPATIATGMEITSAPGQPITSSVNASTTSPVIRPVIRASRMMLGGVQVEQRSMDDWVRALASWVSSTRWMIRARVVSAPMPVARTCRKPPPEMVPANTWSPSAFSTGMDSPVIDASSRAPVPPMTMPSTGTLAPLLTRTVSSCCTWAAGTSTCAPSRITTATSGAVQGARFEGVTDGEQEGHRGGLPVLADDERPDGGDRDQQVDGDGPHHQGTDRLEDDRDAGHESCGDHQQIRDDHGGRTVQD